MCPFWKDIIGDAFGGIDKVDGKEIYKLRQKSAYMRHIPLMVQPYGKKILKSNQKKFSKILEKLYHAIKRKTG